MNYYYYYNAKNNEYTIAVEPSQPLQVVPQSQQGGAGVGTGTGAGLPFVPVPQPLPQAQVPTFPQPQQGPMFGQPPQVSIRKFILDK